MSQPNEAPRPAGQPNGADASTSETGNSKGTSATSRPKFKTTAHLLKQGLTKEEVWLVARLHKAGIPVIAVGPDDTPRQSWLGIKAPADCQLSLFREGDALLMLCGHGLDVVDVDTKVPGNSVANLPPFRSYGESRTPSGGQHLVVPSNWIGKISPLAGVGDYCSGKKDGTSRLGVFLPGSRRTKYPDGGYEIVTDWDIEGCLAASPDLDLTMALIDLVPETSRDVRKEVAWDGKPATDRERQKASAVLAKRARALAALQPGEGRRSLLLTSLGLLYRFALAEAIDRELVDTAMREAVEAQDATGDDHVATWDSVSEDAWTYALRLGAVRPTVDDEPKFEPIEDEEDLLGVLPDKTRGVVSGRIADGRLGQKLKRRVLPEPGAPAKVAARFLADHVGAGNCVEIRTWNGVVHEWAGTRWNPIADGTMMVEIQSFTAEAVYVVATKDGDKQMPWNPTDAKKRDLLNAIKQTAGAFILPTVQPNSFFHCDDGHCATGHDEHRWLSFTNGIFDVVTGERIDHSPVFFNLTMRPFAYDRQKGKPKQWLEVLHDYWGHEEDGGAASIAAFQEQFGFLLFGRNSDRLKTVVVWQGDGDTGKSMVTDLLSLLLGDRGMVGLYPRGFVDKFGREVLLTAEVGIFTEADFTGVGKAATVMIKAISGFDVHNAQRKGKTDVSGKVNARLMMVTNEVPRLDDASGAINNRIQATRFSRVFSEDERDLGLLEKLGEEFDEIAMWALDGYIRAIGRGGLRMSQSGQTLAAEIAGKSSPLVTWFGERVREDPDGKLTPSEACEDYGRWCEENGLNYAPAFIDTRAFSSALKRDRPAMVTKVAKLGGQATRVYVGYSLVADTD